MTGATSRQISFMQFNKIYIISYLGQDDETIQNRMRMHRNQLDFANRQKLNAVVLSQNYKREYYQTDATYIDHYGHVLRFGEARNILLEHFYNSDDDYAVFADNDCYLYQGQKYGHNDVFADTFRNIPLRNLEHIDLFTALNPKNVPFTKDLENNARLYQTHWSFVPAYIAQGLFVLKNLKKFYNTEIYFDNAFVKPDRSILACEDQDFPIQIIHKGYGTYMCKNIIMKDESTTSTWTVQDREIKRLQTKEGHDFISRKFNLPIQTESKQGSWMKRFKQINTRLKPRLVKLTEIYDSQVLDLFENTL